MTEITGDAWNDFVVGAAPLEPGAAGGLEVHRLPAWARAQLDDAMFGWVESCPTGVRVRFTSTAPVVELVVAATTVAAPGVDAGPISLVARSGERREELPLDDPSVVTVSEELQIAGIERRPPQTVRVLVAGPEPVEVQLPHNARVELIALRADGELAPAASTGRRWTHYGSSISQGMNAVAADRTWPVAAATTLGWNLRNLSFAGNAQLDGFAARTIRDAAADLITLKIGINLLNADSMRERTFAPAVHAFLDTIREGQPETPIVLISALACPIHEDTPGPVTAGPDGMAAAASRSVVPDKGALTLARTREILAGIVARRADPHLSYLDGRELFGPDDVDLLYDRLHPDQAGLDLIAERFVAHFG